MLTTGIEGTVSDCTHKLLLVEKANVEEALNKDLSRSKTNLMIMLSQRLDVRCVRGIYRS